MEESSDKRQKLNTNYEFDIKYNVTNSPKESLTELKGKSEMQDAINKSDNNVTT